MPFQRWGALIGLIACLALGGCVRKGGAVRAARSRGDSAWSVPCSDLKGKTVRNLDKYDSAHACLAASTPDDQPNKPDGFLHCAQNLSKEQGATVNTVGDAVKEFNTCLANDSRSQLVLIGHGDPYGGVQTIGSGTLRSAEETPPCVPKEDGIHAFEALSKSTRGTHEILLLGCWVGARRTGEALVQDVATITVLRTKAQNSVIFCEPEDNGNPSVLYEDSMAQWQDSQSLKELPIEWSDYNERGKDKCITVVDQKGDMCTVRKVDVRTGKLCGQAAIAYELYDSANLKTLGASPLKREFQITTLGTNLEIQAPIFAAIDGPHPFVPGFPDLLPTAGFIFRVAKDRCRHYTVMGDVLLRDDGPIASCSMMAHDDSNLAIPPSRNSVYYRLSPGFAQGSDSVKSQLEALYLSQ